MKGFTEEECKLLLSEKMKQLEKQGESRYPKRSDFTDEEVCAIKAHLGPWPRALEKAGVKPVTGTSSADKNREKRIMAKRKRTEAMKAAKKAGALVILWIVCGLFFGRAALADEQKASVFVVIANGEVQIAKDIDVTDADGDGILSIHDALFLTHELYYEGGAQAGYGAENTAYGLSMTKLWGVENGGSYGYYRNNQTPMSLADQITEGDFIYAYVYTDTVGFSDTYTFFEESVKECETFDSVTLKVNQLGFDETWNMVSSPLSGATILIDGVDSGRKTGTDGSITMVLETEGLHLITVKSDDMRIVPAVCRVMVSQKTVRSANDIFVDIISGQIGDKSWVFYSSLSPFQSFVDDGIAPKAGDVGDWYMIGLSRLYSLNTDVYVKFLEQYIESHPNVSAVTKERYALAMIACDYASDFVQKTADECIGAQGLMSYAYGLILLSNGVTTKQHTVGDIIAELLSKQLADGGWALSGTASDTDVTAIVLQALAPYRAADTRIENAIQNGVTCLVKKQSETGEFSSYGVCNAESTAQVILALAALDIDPLTDSRFIRNGRTLNDVLDIYRVADGWYAHTEGGDANEMATVQVFLAATALSLQKTNSGSLYLWDASRVPLEEAKNLPKIRAEEDDKLETPDIEEGKSKQDEKNPNQSETERNNKNTKNGDSKRIKLFIILGIAALALVACVIGAIRKKGSKFFLLILLIGLAACGAVLLLKIQSPKEYYEAEAKENVVGKVTMSIRCDTVSVKYPKSELVPKDGTILPNTEFAIEEGDTVYDVLCDAAKAYHLQVDHSGDTPGSEKMVYISGIQYLYEADFGDLSGWVYHVNGESPAKSCGDYVLSDGDRILWAYSLNLGEDVQEGIDD